MLLSRLLELLGHQASRLLSNWWCLTPKRGTSDRRRAFCWNIFCEKVQTGSRRTRDWGREAPRYFCSQTQPGSSETVPALRLAGPGLAESSCFWGRALQHFGASPLRPSRRLREKEDAVCRCWKLRFWHCSPDGSEPQGSPPWTLLTRSDNQLEDLQLGLGRGCRWARRL